MKNRISRFIAKQMKDNGFFGDYILAKRLQPDYPCDYFYGNNYTVRTVIDRSIRWSSTPQGSNFWMNIYNKI